MVERQGRFSSIAMVAVGAALVVQPALAGPPRARTLQYDPNRKEWIEVPPPPLGTPDGDLHAIRLQIKAERYRPALSGVKRFVKRHGTGHAAYAGVQLAEADALIARRAYDKAHRVLQEFLDRFGGTEHTAEALRLEFLVAEAYLGGAKRRFVGLPLFSGVEDGYEILDEISTTYPEESIAELAIKTKADHLFAQGEHLSAQAEYARLLHDHPSSRYHQFALKRTAEAALAGFAGIEFDDAPLLEAEDRFLEYRQRYRASAEREGVGLILDTIRERRAQKALQVGSYYERTEHFGSAVFSYQRVRQRWPESTAARRATVRLERLGAVESNPETEPS